MATDKEKVEKSVKDFFSNNKLAGMGGIVLISLAGVYLLGHVFKITAHTVRGFNEMRASFRNE